MHFYGYNKKTHLGETLTGDSYAVAVMCTGRAPGPQTRQTCDTHETKRTVQVWALLQSSLLKDSVLGSYPPTAQGGRTQAHAASWTVVDWGAGGGGGCLTAEFPP